MSHLLSAVELESSLGQKLSKRYLKDPAVQTVTDFYDGQNNIMVIKCNIGDRVLYHGLKDMVVVQPGQTADGMIRWLGHMSHREPRTNHKPIKEG